MNTGFPMQARAVRGFTLIEMMVVVAIIAILAALAWPAYSNYILRSKMRVAQSDLLAWSAIVENHRQRTLRFPSDPATAMSGFQPASKAIDFGFTYPEDGGGYPLTATGTQGGRLAGCTFRLDADGSRHTSGCPNVGGAEW